MDARFDQPKSLIEASLELQVNVLDAALVCADVWLDLLHTLRNRAWYQLQTHRPLIGEEEDRGDS